MFCFQFCILNGIQSWQVKTLISPSTTALDLHKKFFNWLKKTNIIYISRPITTVHQDMKSMLHTSSTQHGWPETQKTVQRASAACATVVYQLQHFGHVLNHFSEQNSSSNILWLWRAQRAEITHLCPIFSILYF